MITDTRPLVGASTDMTPEAPGIGRRYLAYAAVSPSRYSSLKPRSALKTRVIATGLRRRAPGATARYQLRPRGACFARRRQGPGHREPVGTARVRPRPPSARPQPP